VEDELAGYQIQREFRPDNTKQIIHLDNVPIARIVNARDPVRHVPAGAGELPSALNLNALTFKQDKEHKTAILDSRGPQAGDGAHTEGIGVPVDIDSNSYVHLGHQWVHFLCRGVPSVCSKPTFASRYSMAIIWKSCQAKETRMLMGPGASLRTSSHILAF